MAPTMPCCSQDDLSARFPWLVCDGLAAGCFGLSGEGWLDPYLFMSLFRKAAVAKGVEVIGGDVAAIAQATAGCNRSR